MFDTELKNKRGGHRVKYSYWVGPDADQMEVIKNAIVYQRKNISEPLCRCINVKYRSFFFESHASS